MREGGRKSVVFGAGARAQHAPLPQKQPTVQVILWRLAAGRRWCELETGHMVKFGLRVPEFAIDGSSAAELLAQVDDMLAAGRGHCASAWISDHFMLGPSSAEPPIANLEAWTTLTYLAAQHPAYWVGPIVLAQSYRPPALLAKMAATLQTMSGGRLVLGL